jgi:hypothetical protein
LDAGKGSQHACKVLEGNAGAVSKC